MASKVDHLQALIMRRQGKTLQEIADVYDVSRERIRQIVGKVDIGSAACRRCGRRFDKKTAHQVYCSRTCGRRFADERYWLANQDECPNCGGPKMMSSSQCRNCWNASRRRSERNATVVQMWADGASMCDIADAIGVTHGGIGQKINNMRRAGADLPYRRSVFPDGSPTFPEQVR